MREGRREVSQLRQLEELVRGEDPGWQELVKAEVPELEGDEREQEEVQGIGGGAELGGRAETMREGEGQVGIHRLVE